jgi:hypothetical protein
MKAFGLLSLLLTLGIVAYMMVGNGGPGPSAASQLAEAQNAHHMEDSARRAMAASNLDAVRASINAYHSAKGQWPASLDELKDGDFAVKVPDGVVYDASSGEVKLAQP